MKALEYPNSTNLISKSQSTNQSTNSNNIQTSQAISAFELSSSPPGLAPGGSMSGGVAPLYLSLTVAKSGTNKETLDNQKIKHKQNKFQLKAHRGVEVGLARGLRFRWFVLTQSPEAIALGLNFGKAFHNFIRWLRKVKKCKDFQYMVVEHLQGARNWHILSYGSDKLPVHAIRRYWKEHYKSLFTGLEEVKSIDDSINYLAGYLSKEEKFVRAWCSQGWVFRGWLGISQNHKRRYGQYLSKDTIVNLALMPKYKRELELLLLQNTGKDSTQLNKQNKDKLIEAIDLLGGVVSDNIDAPIASGTSKDILKTWANYVATQQSKYKTVVIYAKQHQAYKMVKTLDKLLNNKVVLRGNLSDNPKNKGALRVSNLKLKQRGSQ